MDHQTGSKDPSSSNPLDEVLPNPLSDTTTASEEPARPTLVDPRSARSKAGAVNVSTAPNTGVGHTEASKGQDEHINDHAKPENSPTDGTWGSNTLTLASSTAVTGLPKAYDTGRVELDWEETFERQKRERWQEKVRQDLEGWRGGHGTPRSNYSPTAVTANSYYGSPVTGTIGRDLPKEVLRVERDWSGGEVCQFETSFPMELDRRISPTQFHDFVTDLNTHLSTAYSTKAAVIDNLIAIATWWLSLWFRPSHFEMELRRIEDLISQANKETFNPVGLNVLSPRRVALQFLEIEYY